MNLFEKFKNRIETITSSPSLSQGFTSTSRVNKRVYQILNTNIKTLNTYYKYCNDILKGLGTDHHQKYKVCKELRVYSDDATDNEINVRASMLLKVGELFTDQSSFIKTLFIFVLSLRSNYNLLTGSQYLIDSLPNKVLINFDEYLKVLLTSNDVSLSNPAYGIFVFYSDPQLLDLYLDLLNTDEDAFIEFMKNEVDCLFEIVNKRIRSIQSSALKIEALLFSLFRVIIDVDTSITDYVELIEHFIDLVSRKLNSLDSQNFKRILSYEPSELNLFRDFLLSLNANERAEFVKCIRLDITTNAESNAEVAYEEELSHEDVEVYEGHNVSITTSSRRGHNRFKRFLVKQSSINGVCKCAIPICPVTGEKFLIASHILPWQKSSAKEKVDPNNGLLLCPNHDLLFDFKLFSFDQEGKIIISETLSEQNKNAFLLNSDIVLDLSEEKKVYISKHRNVMLSGEW